MLQWNYWWRRIPLQVVEGKEYQGEAAATFNVKISNFAHLGWISAMTPSSVMSSHQKLIGIGLLMISTRTETLIPIGLPILSSIEWGSYWRIACCSKHAMNRSSAVIPAASRTKNMYLISVVAPISCHCFIYIPSIAVIPAAISLLLQMIEAQARYARASSGKSFQLVHCWLKVRHCEKFASLRQNKMPSRKQDAAPEGEEQQEASQGPPSKKARPPGRKQSKDKLKKWRRWRVQGYDAKFDGNEGRGT